MAEEWESMDEREMMAREWNKYSELFKNSGYKEGKSAGSDTGLSSGFAQGLVVGAEHAFSWSQLWAFESALTEWQEKFSNGSNSVKVHTGTPLEDKLREKRVASTDFIVSNEPVWNEDHQRELQRVQEKYTEFGVAKPICYSLRK